MPIEFKVYHEQEFYIASWSGFITNSDCLNAYSQFVASEKFIPGYSELADCRKADLSTITAECVIKLAKIYESALVNSDKEMKTAVIVDSKTPSLVAQIYKNENSKFETIEIFQEFSEAQKWLGIEIDILL